MKRRKTKITNIQTVQSEEFLQKYSYITFDDRLTLTTRGIMFTILSFPKETVLTASLIKTRTADSKAEIQSSLEELVSVDYIRKIDSLTEEPAYICNVD